MSKSEPYAGDPTLIDRLTRAQLAQYGLLLFDLLIPLFLDGDIGELKRTPLPNWWWVVAVAAQLVLTFCILFYLYTTEKYLCCYRPSARVKALRGIDRKAEASNRNLVASIVGWSSAIFLLMASLLPHLMTRDDPLIMLGAGLIVFKTTSITAMLQGAFFLASWIDIKNAVVEWKELRKTDYPNLTFKRYALRYDGTDESLRG